MTKIQVNKLDCVRQVVRTSPPTTMNHILMHRLKHEFKLNIPLGEFKTLKATVREELRKEKTNGQHIVTPPNPMPNLADNLQTQTEIKSQITAEQLRTLNQHIKQSANLKEMKLEFLRNVINELEPLIKIAGSFTELQNSIPILIELRQEPQQ